MKKRLIAISCLALVLAFAIFAMTSCGKSSSVACEYEGVNYLEILNEDQSSEGVFTADGKRITATVTEEGEYSALVQADGKDTFTVTVKYENGDWTYEDTSDFEKAVIIE